MANKTKSATSRKTIIKKRKKSITLTGKEIQKLIDDEVLEGYEDFEADADYNTGKFMSSKSAMVDFEIYLYDKKTDTSYTGRGGYYNEGCGFQFNENEIVFKQD